MAHRGLIEELFQLAYVALLFGKSEKDDIPSLRTYIQTKDPRKHGHLYPKMVLLEPLPAEPTGLLPSIFSLVTLLISLLMVDFSGP